MPSALLRYRKAGQLVYVINQLLVVSVLHPPL